MIVLLACGRSRDTRGEFEHTRQLFMRGDLSHAQLEAESAYTYYAPRDPEWSAKFRVLDARILSWRGRNPELLDVLKFEIPPSLKNTETDIRKQELEGLAQARLHRFPEAEESLAGASRICAASGSPVIGEVLIARGLLEIEEGEYQKAERLFQQGQQAARQAQDRFVEAMALLNLNHAALLQQHFDDAIGWLQSAEQISGTIDAKLMTEIALGNLGWAYYKTGEPERASDLFSEAEKRAVELGSDVDQVRWLTTAGWVYMDSGEFPAAADNYMKALELARKINAPEDVSDATLSLAFVSIQAGKLDLAKQYSDEAIAMARAGGNRQDELYALLASAQIAVREHNPAAAENIFLEIVRDPKVDPSLKWGAQHELANLYASNNHDAEADRAYRTTLATFESARSSLRHEEVRLPFLGNAGSIYDDYIQFLVSQGKSGEALQLADFSRARTLAEGLGLLSQTNWQKSSDFSPERTSRQLGATILFYWLGARQSYLWAVTPDRISLFPLPAASEIDESVRRYRKALIAGRDPIESANPDGSKLFEVLVGPARKLIARRSRVVVIPDGSLNNLNFETLLVSEPQPHYWIEDVTVSDASSIRLLAASGGEAQPKGKLLLIGDAVASGSQYGELPKAAAEMQNIEQHFARAEQSDYARDKATPAAYLAGHPEQFAYIHFVAHGTASRLTPLDSAVVLSKASTEEDSYKLYARDIIQRPLHARLVTISTCYGAGARAYTGEGLVGLSWAFLRAGAHNVIGALWEVSDASTPELMDQLYTGLKNGKSPESALRAAKLSLLHSDGVFRKPFYWAPFQLYSGS